MCNTSSDFALLGHLLVSGEAFFVARDDIGFLGISALVPTGFFAGFLAIGCTIPILDYRFTLVY